MIIDGIIEKIIGNSIYGWILLDEQFDNIFLKLNIDNKYVCETIPRDPRPDLTINGKIGLGFKIDSKLINGIADQIPLIGLIAECDGQSFQLRMLTSIEKAREISALPDSQLKIFSNHLTHRTREYLSDTMVTNRFIDGSYNKRKLCVITYANDCGAWFPFFYKYYSSIVGSDQIYIVTPKIESFKEYNLGGLISFPEMNYDDRARSKLMSNLACGL